MSTTGSKAIELIKSFESLHDGDLSKLGLQPKPDPIGIYTEGYGRAMIDPNTKKFLTTKTTTKAQAEALATIDTVEEATAALAMDIKPRERTAVQMLGEAYANRLNPEQFGSVVSFIYNAGTGAKKPYLLFGNVRAFLDGKMTADALRKYWDSSVIKGGGRVLPGLIRRRKAEAHLFLTGVLKTNW